MIENISNSLSMYTWVIWTVHSSDQKGIFKKKRDLGPDPQGLPQPFEEPVFKLE